MNRISQEILSRLGVSYVDALNGIAEYRMSSNGLTILLLQDNAAPVVSLMVAYRVGSKDEAVGYTGSTHMLEHMMFKGTDKHNPADGNGIDELLKPIGAQLNANTWMDRTNYFECVPSEHLETCLMLEADRMRNLKLKQEDRASEMRVVRRELSDGEDNPFRVMLQEMFATAFREHPYHHPTIGWRSDVENMPIERLKQFYDEFYWPNNATVIISGDFNSESALELVVKHFGPISSSPKPIPQIYTVEPAQQGERRFEVGRASFDLPQAWVGYRVPEATHPDIYALSVLASVLDGDSRSSRLYKRLVDTGLASSASTFNFELRHPGIFIVSAKAAPDKTAQQLEDALIDEIGKLSSEPITEGELSRAKTANRKRTLLAVADPMRRASRIAEHQAVADWKWGVRYDDHFDQVTAADVMRVVQTYFGQDNRTVGYCLPRKAEVQIKVDEVAATTKGSAFKDNVVATKLGNGLSLQVLPTKVKGSLAIFGRVAAGVVYGSKEKPLVPELVAYMLNRGSAKYTKLQLAELVEEMGADLRFGSDNFSVTFRAELTTTDLGKYIELAADALLNPTFPQDEFEKSKREFAAFIIQHTTDTNSTAKNALIRTLYASDSTYFEKSFQDMLVELDQITLDDVTAFHRNNYGPAGTLLTVVGDVDPNAVKELVESSFGSWAVLIRAPLEVKATLAAAVPTKRVEVDMPDKDSVCVMVGLPAAVKITDADYLAAKIGNAALGGSTLSSRLGLAVRVRGGLTYGIRSGFDDARFGGAPWLVDLTVDATKVDKALELINQEVRNFLAEGITDKELADEAANMSGTFKVGLRTSMGIASSLNSFEFVGLGVEGMDTYDSRLKAVTKEAVNAAARKYFDPERLITVLAGTLAK